MSRTMKEHFSTGCSLGLRRLALGMEGRLGGR
jgi:hypothetical protein